MRRAAAGAEFPAKLLQPACLVQLNSPHENHFGIAVNALRPPKRRLRLLLRFPFPLAVRSAIA